MARVSYSGKTVGARHLRLIRSCVLPNVLSMNIIGASLRISGDTLHDGRDPRLRGSR
jgi:ABC-type dipeptide/oligopeptide/nickel transport system permease subunit